MSKNIKLPDFATFLRALDPYHDSDYEDSDDSSTQNFESLLDQLTDAEYDHTYASTPQRDYDSILEDIRDTVKQFESDPPSPDTQSSLVNTPSTSPDIDVTGDSDTDRAVSSSDDDDKKYIWHHYTCEDFERKPPTDLLDVTPPASPESTTFDHCDSAIRHLLTSNPNSSIHFIKRENTGTQDSPSDTNPCPADQHSEPPPPLFATFSNVPTLFMPFHPVSYIVHISIYPKSATGTLYERISGSVCARSTLCDEQVFAVYRLDERQGIDYVVRYLTSSLLVTVVMHNEVFQYKIDFRRIPIKVCTHDGQSLEYTY